MKNVYSILIFVIALLVTAVSTHAQTQAASNSIIIKNNQHPEQEAFYKGAILRANMETYRLKSTNVTITFAEGFECELVAASTLVQLGSPIDVDSYQNSFSTNFILPVFSITADGYLIATYQKTGK